MTVLKYGSEARALRKMEEECLHVFQRNCLRIALGNQLTDPISNSKLYKNVIQFLFIGL